MSEKTKKARYSVTLSVDRVKEFRTACKKLNLPAATMSHAFDDILRDVTAVFNRAIDKGTMGVVDLFNVLGEQLQDYYDTERKEHECQKLQKADTKRN